MPLNALSRPSKYGKIYIVRQKSPLNKGLFFVRIGNYD